MEQFRVFVTSIDSPWPNLGDGWRFRWCKTSSKVSRRMFTFHSAAYYNQFWRRLRGLSPFFGNEPFPWSRFFRLPCIRDHSAESIELPRCATVWVRWTVRFADTGWRVRERDERAMTVPSINELDWLKFDYVTNDWRENWWIFYRLKRHWLLALIYHLQSTSSSSEKTSVRSSSGLREVI